MESENIQDIPDILCWIFIAFTCTALCVYSYSDSDYLISKTRRSKNLPKTDEALLQKNIRPCFVKMTKLKVASNSFTTEDGEYNTTSQQQNGQKYITDYFKRAPKIAMMDWNEIRLDLIRKNIVTDDVDAKTEDNALNAVRTRKIDITDYIKMTWQ